MLETAQFSTWSGRQFGEVFHTDCRLGESLGNLFYWITDHAEDFVTRQTEFDEITDGSG